MENKYGMQGQNCAVGLHYILYGNQKLQPVKKPNLVRKLLNAIPIKITFKIELKRPNIQDNDYDGHLFI